jgi:hypothetical protein
VTILSAIGESFKVWLRVILESEDDDYRAPGKVISPPAPRSRHQDRWRADPEWREARSLG